MCTVDKKVCFRKLINRVIVANGGDEFNQIVALRLFWLNEKVNSTVKLNSIVETKF